VYQAGDAGAPLDQAAAMPSATSGETASTTWPSASTCAGGCDGVTGPWIGIDSGAVLVQVGPPASGPFDPRPVFPYSSNSPVGQQGYGQNWAGTFYRRVVGSSSMMVATLTTGAGNLFRYVRDDPNSPPYFPTGQARNALSGGTSTSPAWVETQADGVQYSYSGTAGSGGHPPVGSLTQIKDRAGGTWTLVYPTNSDRPSAVIDPYGRRTSITYDPSGYLSSIQDAGGRITRFKVDSNGNLVRYTSPELCITSFSYGAGGFLQAWIAPQGTRTTFARIWAADALEALEPGRVHRTRDR
jgi:YD repeat-containing protein